MGDGIKYGIATQESLGHLSYWLAKRCPKISNDVCEKVLHLEFPKRKRDKWFTIQRFAVYRGDADHSPEQLGVKDNREANAVLKRIDSKIDILSSICRRASLAAGSEFAAAVRNLNRGDRQGKARGRSAKEHARPQSEHSAEAIAVEGMLKEIRRFDRARNHSLRDRKLSQSNGRCEACRTDFSKLLGGEGRRVLLVHHDRRHLSDYRDDGEITSEKDLAVICANCHMLLHSNPNRPLKVKALRRKLHAAYGITS